MEKLFIKKWKTEMGFGSDSNNQHLSICQPDKLSLLFDMQRFVGPVIYLYTHTKKKNVRI